MKAKDIIELEKNVITLIEHDAIIARFDDTSMLDRDEALAKYGKFNNEHPEFYDLHKDICESQGCLTNLGETDNKTIVDNMKCQRDWLYKKSISKFGEEILKEFIHRTRD